MTSDLDALPDLPRDTDSPVFREPAEAIAFALAFACTSRACSPGKNGRPCCLRRSTLLRLMGIQTWATPATSIGPRPWSGWSVTRAGAVGPMELDQRTDRWRRAYLNTPHGRPIQLSAAD